MSASAEASTVFAKIGDGQKQAVAELFAILYERLRQHAKYLMSQERKDHTLQPTALVNEAFLKLAAGKSLTWESRRHFYNAAADAMRKILVDHARCKSAKKRGGELSLQTLSDLNAADDNHREVDIASLDAALAKLQKFDERRYRVVMYRYFAGLKEAEIAQLLAVTVKTVQRDWQTARIFLLARIRNRSSEGEGKS